MAYKKLSTTTASSKFNKAQSYNRMAMNDQNDPASTNLLSAIDHYFGAIGTA